MTRANANTIPIKEDEHATFPLPQSTSDMQCHPLVLSRTGLRELKPNTTTSQLLINLAISIKSMIHTTLLLLIQDDLQNFATIFLGPKSLADNLNWVDQISEDGVVDSGQCSGTRTLLREGSAGAVAALRAGEDAARSKD